MAERSYHEAIVVGPVKNTGSHQFGFFVWADVVLDCGHKQRLVLANEADRGRPAKPQVGDLLPCRACTRTREPLVARTFWGEPVGEATRRIARAGGVPE